MGCINPVVYDGIGTLADVLYALCNVPESEKVYAKRLQDMADTMQVLLTDERSSADMFALFCAVLNADFRKTGYLYSVGDGGKFRHQYFMGNADREMIAKLAGI